MPRPEIEKTLKEIEELVDRENSVQVFGRLPRDGWEYERDIPVAGLKALAAEYRRVLWYIETIRNMNVYQLADGDPNPDSEFMRDFYRTKFADAIGYAEAALGGDDA